MRRERERIEQPLVRRALKELGVPSIPLKLNRGVDTGWPDQLFLIPGGKPLFVELKDGSNQLAVKQSYKAELLKELGYDVETHRDVEGALDAIRAAKKRAEGYGKVHS